MNKMDNRHAKSIMHVFTHDVAHAAKMRRGQPIEFEYETLYLLAILISLSSFVCPHGSTNCRKLNSRISNLFLLLVLHQSH